MLRGFPHLWYTVQLSHHFCESKPCGELATTTKSWENELHPTRMGSLPSLRQKQDIFLSPDDSGASHLNGQAVQHIASDRSIQTVTGIVTELYFTEGNSNVEADISKFSYHIVDKISNNSKS